MDNDYKLSFTSRDCIDSIKNIIDKADHSIDIEAFYFIYDTIGGELLDLLIAKAAQGVQIRLLFDHVGSYEISKSPIIKYLRANGVKVKFFNSIFPFSRNQKTIWFLRNHRRTIIIDDKYLFIGSVCFGEPAIEWKELGIVIKDRIIINKTKKVFNRTWFKTYGHTFNIGSTSKKDLSNIYNFNYITQSPLQMKRYIYRYYLKSIKESKSCIYLIAPYFVPNKRFIRHLIKASKRHVSVNIILPANTDLKIVDLARNTYIHNLLKNGVNVYFHNEMIHSKFAIFDNREAFIGTMNLDNLSFSYNYECGLKVLDQKCISDLTHYVTNDLIAKSNKIEMNEWSKRSLITKIKEKFVWLFRKLL
jgi:cardiolipin synthase